MTSVMLIILGVWFVAPITSISAFGSSDPAVSTPRGRWYLKLRPTMRWRTPSKPVPSPA